MQSRAQMYHYLHLNGRSGTIVTQLQTIYYRIFLDIGCVQSCCLLNVYRENVSVPALFKYLNIITSRHNFLSCVI